MASKFNRVASMGSKSSKYGNQRAAYFEKGDTVIVAREHRGVVVKATASYVIVEINGEQAAYNPRYVEEVA